MLYSEIIAVCSEIHTKHINTVQTGPGAYPASYTMGTGSLSRGWSGRGVELTKTLI
jgi:hypothetical protein